MDKKLYPRIGEEVIWETLDNGLPVCIVPKQGFSRKYALFATRYGGMDMRFELNGQWLDTPAGIAHYLEHKMFDTKDGNALQELAKNGAEPNAFTSNAITCYYFDSTEKFYENLEILLSFVSVPYFTDESVEKEQGIIGQEIGMIEDNPDWQLYTRMMQALYQKSTARTSRRCWPRQSGCCRRRAGRSSGATMARRRVPTLPAAMPRHRWRWPCPRSW